MALSRTFLCLTIGNMHLNNVSIPYKDKTMRKTINRFLRYNQNNSIEAVHCCNTSTMKKQSLLFYAICLLFVFAAKASKYTAYVPDSLTYEGNNCLNMSS